MALANPATSPDLPLSGRSIGRFAVGDLLGAGGMGEVYRAEDTTLKRTVALKRVGPKLRHDSRVRQRLLHEAERASALNSPHIAAIYDVLEQQDEMFLVMEFVEGATLREHLQRTPPTPQQFIAIAVQCAEALDNAQQKRIVHGDVKPENIMLTAGGQVKVLDFGLAKQLPAPEDAPLESTQSVSLSGTPGYIAPEVLLGQEADPRSDLFSLGVVFYEALARRHPFAGRTITAAADRTLHETPPPLHEVASETPVELERIVAKMMAKDPAERYATSADLLVDLRAVQRGAAPALPARRTRVQHALRVFFVVIALIILVSVLPSFQQQWRHWFVGPDLPEKKNLAVLAFVASTDDNEARAFAHGLTESVTAKLTLLTDKYPLQVVPPVEMRDVKSAREAGSALGANLVLEGSLHRAGNQVRVAYRLVDPRSLNQLRADTVAADASDPFGVEDRVVDSVLLSLGLQLGAQQRQAIEAPRTLQPAAYELYLRGRGYLQDYADPRKVENAIADFNQAIARDATYGLAYAGLGESYWHKYEKTASQQWVQQAQSACEKAASLGTGHVCLGTVFNGTGRYELAVRQFSEALQLDGTSDDAYRGLAFAYEKLGRTADAEQVYRRAITVRPQYWAGYNWLGTFLERAGRLEEAAEIFRQVIAVAPGNVRGYSNLGGVYIEQGKYNEAIPVLNHAIEIYPDSDSYSNLATAYFYLRKFDDASRNYAAAVKLEPSNYIAWGDLAETDYWAGRRSDALQAYRRAITLGDEALKVNSRDAGGLGRLAVYHAMIGEKRPAQELIMRALKIAPNSAGLCAKAAIVQLQAGDRSAAVRWLAKAVNAKLPPSQITNNPIFDQLSGDPRFEALLPQRPG